MKKCFKCKKKKPLNEFYKHPKMPDGHLNKCKDCTKMDVSDNYEKNVLKPGFIEKERKRGRNKYRRLYVGTGRAKPENNKRYAVKYPEKILAQYASAKLKKPANSKGLEKHHWSYLEEHFKDVVWLLKKDHMKSHRFLIYDQERRMYRRYDTNELLDTKEKHETFILHCIFHKED